MPDDFDWHVLANGGATRPMLIGRLHSVYCRMLGCSTDAVLLDPPYAAKLRFKHGLDAGHFKVMPMTMRFGTIYTDRPNTISFMFADRNIFQRIFHLSVKTTGRRHELWVSTFFAVSESDYRRRLKKAVIHKHQA